MPEILGLPETVTLAETLPVALLAKELPSDLWEEYGSKYIIFGPGYKNEDKSMTNPYNILDGTKIWLTRRNEKKMFDGVDWMVNNILYKLNGKKPLAVFHADCALRGKFSLSRILKDELINHLQYPICKGENIPWIGMYTGGEFAMLGGKSFLHLITSSLFVIYR